MGRLFEILEWTSHALGMTRECYRLTTLPPDRLSARPHCVTGTLTVPLHPLSWMLVFTHTL